MKERDLTNKYLEVGELIQRGRRAALKAGAVGLGASAFTLLSGSLLAPSVALAADKAGDVKIANVALNLEHQAIAAYGVGAGTGLLEGTALAAAKLFLSHHEAHRDSLIGVIKKFGGTPVEPKKDPKEYEAIAEAVPKIKSATDVLEFALTLEEQAAGAYIGVLTSFSEKDLIPVLAGIGAAEAQHAALLRFVLQKSPLLQGPVVK
ncbi:MAG: ferritin [Chloracidobacterium sp. CP2_5A]|nr:MAG: ferritin [Chloracidobacterium sp. CP2_5A]